MYQLRLFGGVSLVGPSGAASGSAAQQRPLALLALLAVSNRKGCSRDKLIGYLWPDSDQDRARHRLADIVYLVRKPLGEDVIVASGETLLLNSAMIESDVGAFLDAVEAGDAEAAVALYEGPFLDGFVVSGATSLERWIESERRRLGDLFSSTLESLALKARTRGDHPGAVQWWKRLVAHDPYNSRHALGLIDALSTAGDRANARLVLADHERLLRVDLEIELSSDVRTRAEALLNAAPRAEVPGPTDGTPLSEGTLHLTPRPAGGVERVAHGHSTIETPERSSQRQKPSSVGLRVAVGVAAMAVATGVIMGWRVVLRPPQPVRLASRQLTFTGDVLLSAISPDGQFLATVAAPRASSSAAPGTGNGQQVVLRDLAGGLPDTIAVLPVIYSLEWSQDGTQLLIGSVQQALVLPRMGGPMRRVPLPKDFQLTVNAYWLPTGSRVSVHTVQTRRVLVVDLASGDTLAVPVEGAYDALWEGSWSPSERLFAVVTVWRDPPSWSLRTVDLSGTTQILIEGDTVPLGSPRWSPTGDAVFFARGAGSIWRIPVSATTGRRRGAPEELVSGLEVLPWGGGRLHFSLTRDGRQIAYARGRQFSNLWIVKADANGTSTRRTTSGSALRWAPAPSPDGQWIAFAEQAGGDAELFRVAFDGGAPSQITVGARVRLRSQIAWSADGRRVAFVSARPRGVRIWVADIATGQIRELSHTRPSLTYPHLTWAPSARIAYNDTRQRNIRLVDPRSGKEDRLLDDTTRGWLFSPHYSPDGQRLAIDWSRNLTVTESGVWVFDTRGPGAAKLRAPTASPIGWSADGRYVYAQADETIYRLNAQASVEEEPLLAMPWRAADCSPAGQQHPDTFVCAVPEFVSDAWLIDFRARR